MTKKFSFLLVALLFIGHLFATPTQLTIRVRARDAKFIGTGIGGALVLVKNNLTGELLAKGTTTGSSGDTKLLLQTPLLRGQSLTDDKTAKYVATLDIGEPVLVDVEVIAPVSRRASAIKGSVQLWLIPGKDILGDGIIIELPGYVLDILQPNTHQIFGLDTLQNNTLNFKVSLTMLCGCPISKGGVWNSDNIEIKAILKKESTEIAIYDLHKLNGNNLYEGDVKIEGKGNYELLVYAFSPKDNNTGVDKINFVVQ